MPSGDAPDCATAGVVGPVCGVAGALAADRALRILAGDASAFDHVVTFDGARDVVRVVPVRARPSCPLCGAARTIGDLDASRYAAPMCDAFGDAIATMRPPKARDLAPQPRET